MIRSQPLTAAAILRRWDTRTLADGLGEKPVTIRAWRRRGRFPGRVISALVRFAHATGHDDLTADILASAIADFQNDDAGRGAA